MKEDKIKGLDIIIGFLFIVVLTVLISVYAPYRIGFKEQVSVFFWNSERISWYLYNPGVLACVIGDWLTQFYLVNSIGIALTILLGILSWLGIVRVIYLSGGRQGIFSAAMFPVVIVGAFMVWPHYPVSALVGFLLSIWASCLLSHLAKPEIRSLVMCFGIPVMFIMVGGNAILFAVVSCFLKNGKLKVNLIALIVGLLLMFIVSHYYNLTLKESLIFPVIPGYVPKSWVLLLLPLSVVVVLTISLLNKNLYISIVYAIGSICIFSTSFKDSIIEFTVKIGSLAYNSDWEEVRNEANKNSDSLFGLYYRNLSYAREGRLPDALLDCNQSPYLDGFFLYTPSKIDDLPIKFFSSYYYCDALLEMGDLSDAIDCALFGQSCTPGGYSSRLLHRLAEISVTAGDYEVANKYLNILSRTHNYHDWARDLLYCVEIDSIPEKYLILRSRTSRTDSFFALGGIHAALNAIIADNPMNKVAADYLLCSFLLENDIQTFVNLYDKYWLNGLDRYYNIPKIYQEALLLNVDSDESLKEIVQKYRLSPQIVENYLNFNEGYFNTDSDAGWIREFKDTYWHYLMTAHK